MQEEWRVIKDFPDYAVSNLGRVQRIKNSKCGYRAGTMLSLKPNGTGYPMVNLWNGNIKKKILVHQLVLEAFRSLRPHGKVANHIDAVRTNNHITNLEWITQRENVNHCVRMGRKNAAHLSGEYNPTSKLKTGEAWLIKRLLVSGTVKQKEIAMMFRVTPETISYINCGQRYADVECEGFVPCQRPRMIATGETVGSSKLKDGEVWLIKRLIRYKIPNTIIAKIFKVNRSHISRIGNGLVRSEVVYP